MLAILKDYIILVLHHFYDKNSTVYEVEDKKCIKAPSQAGKHNVKPCNISTYKFKLKYDKKGL